jgi:hypothetical protein
LLVPLHILFFCDCIAAIGEFSHSSVIKSIRLFNTYLEEAVRKRPGYRRPPLTAVQQSPHARPPRWTGPASRCASPADSAVSRPLLRRGWRAASPLVGQGQPRTHALACGGGDAVALHLGPPVGARTRPAAEPRHCHRGRTGLSLPPGAPPTGSGRGDGGAIDAPGLGLGPCGPLLCGIELRRPSQSEPRWPRRGRARALPGAIGWRVCPGPPCRTPRGAAVPAVQEEEHDVSESTASEGRAPPGEGGPPAIRG